MKVLLIVVGVFVALVAVLVAIVFVIGSRLPQGHVASRSIRINRPLTEVYAVVRDVGESHKWRSDVQRVEMLGATESGHIQFREHGSNGIVTYELLEDEPGRRFVTQIVDRDLGYSGSWTYEFSSSGDGTTVKITERGEVSNVLFRFMSRYIFGHAATIDTYLKALSGYFGGSEMPRDAESPAP